MATHTLHIRDTSNDVCSFAFYSQTWDIIAFTGEDDDTQATIVASFRALDDARKYVRDVPNTSRAWGHVIRPPHEVYAQGVAWLRFMAEARTSDGVPLTRYGATV